MKSAGKVKFSAEILDAILASGKAEELQSAADLFAFAFLLGGRHVLSIDDALDILQAHGLPEDVPRAERTERMLRSVRADRAFIPYYGTSFTLKRGADIDERVFEAFMGPGARERLAADTRRAKHERRQQTPMFSKPLPPKRTAKDDAHAPSRSDETSALPRMPPAPPPAPVQLAIAQIVEADIARLRASAIRLKVDAPRPGPIAAAARGFPLRNGVARVAQVSIGSVAYEAALIRYVVETPEHRDGFRWILVGPQGSEPDGAVALLLNPDELAAAADPLGATDEGPIAARWIARRSGAAVHAAVQPFAASVAAKLARQYTQITAESQAKWADAYSAQRDAANNLVAERDAALQRLDAQFAIRATPNVERLFHVTIPAGLAAVRLRRRNVEREIMLSMPAGSHAPDRLACEGCGELTARPAGCDARLHLLCDLCAPPTDGKITCPACRA